MSQNGVELAPLTITELAEALRTGAVQATDFIWDEMNNDWVCVLEFAPLKAHLNSNKPKAKPQGQATVTVSQPMKWPLEWTVRSIGGQMYGPFSVWGIIRALQEKSIFEFDSVKRETDPNWTPIAHHENFNAAAIREWQKKVTAGEYPEVQDEVFFKRQHPRLRLADLFRLESSSLHAHPIALLHNNESVFEAKWIEASRGGTGLLVPSSQFRPGQQINVHFASLMDLPAFNATGEIVSLHRPSGPQSRRNPKDSEVKLGLKYLRIDPKAESDVQSYFDLKARSLKSIA